MSVPNLYSNFSSAQSVLNGTVQSIASSYNAPASISAATTILASQTGTVFSVAKTSAYTITLPTSPPIGTNYKFTVADTGANAVTITSTTAIIYPVCITASVLDAYVPPKTNIVLVASGAVGDMVEVVWDGVRWRALAIAVTTVKITAT